jgi:hypothetical protein
MYRLKLNLVPFVRARLLIVIIKDDVGVGAPRMRSRIVSYCTGALHDATNLVECLYDDFTFRDGGTKRKTPARKSCEWHRNSIIKTPQHYCQGLSTVPIPDNQHVGKW